MIFQNFLEIIFKNIANKGRLIEGGCNAPYKSRMLELHQAKQKQVSAI